MLLVFYFLFRNVWSAGPFSVSFVLMGIFLFIVLDPLSLKKKKKSPGVLQGYFSVLTWRMKSSLLGFRETLMV